jgi:hypothetical protein
LEIEALGFSFGFSYDPADLSVLGVTKSGTSAEAADFFDGRIDAVQGLVGWGCVVDWDDPMTDTIPAGTGNTLAKIQVDVLGPPGTTELTLESVATNPNPDHLVKNVITKNDGKSVHPLLVAGTITIEDRTPVITSIAGNEGPAGTVFQVEGDFFDEPGLAVTVCGVSAEATLQPDGRTLLVTAPACGAAGPVPVEVCTLRGCDDDPEGFVVVGTEVPFVRANANGDAEVDISDGIAVLLWLFVGTFETTCQDSLDANDSGSIDLSDASYIFNYLFTDGAPIPPPFPLAGVDPTPDGLEPCQ